MSVFETQSQLVTDYYHMLGEFLLPQMEEKLLANYRDLKYVEELTQRSQGSWTVKLDRFWWTDCIRQDRRERYAVAVLGRNVMVIGCHGPEDLREYTELFVEALTVG